MLSCCEESLHWKSSKSKAEDINTHATNVKAWSGVFLTPKISSMSVDVELMFWTKFNIPSMEHKGRLKVSWKERASEWVSEVEEKKNMKKSFSRSSISPRRQLVKLEIEAFFFCFVFGLKLAAFFSVHHIWMFSSDHQWAGWDFLKLLEERKTFQFETRNVIKNKIEIECDLELAMAMVMV